MEGSTSKKTKQPPKRMNHKGNIKFLNPLLSREAYQMRKGCDLQKGCHYREGFSSEEPTCKVASSYLK
jgi:hypothetical protein